MLTKWQVEKFFWKHASRLRGPNSGFTYYQDNLFTSNTSDFVNDPRFKKSYAAAMSTNHGHGPDLHIEWRIYICCWAAEHASKLEGDFVECGVNAGMNSRAVAEYVSFNDLHRDFILMDTFSGIPDEQWTQAELANGLARVYQGQYGDMYEQTKHTFAQFERIKLIKGKIPDSLSLVTTKKVSYLSIDMNAVAPEIAAINFFWNIIVPGGIIVLDDYGFRIHTEQKRAFDRFANSKGTSILSLPTGQGLLIK